jgi:hypothetical protein
MNIFILNVMNRENLTIKQLECNFSAADAAAYADAYDDDAAYAAASYAATATAYAAADYADAVYAAAYTEHWLNEYFMQTGESRPDYEAELERDNSFRGVG